MSLGPIVNLLESVPAALVAHDPQGTVVAWNPAAETLLGWRRDEVIGRPSPLPRELLEGAAEVGLTEVATRAGTPLQLSFARVPLPGLGGTALVLWPPQAPVALDAPMLRALFHHAPDGIVVVDRKGSIIDANPAMGRMLGMSRAEHPPGTLWDFMDTSAGGLPTAQEHFGQVLASGRAIGEVPLKRGDGTTLRVDISAAAFAEDRFVGFVRDVTAQRRDALQLRLFSRLFECSGEAIVITDRHNAIIATNNAFTEITGYAFQEVLGKNPSLLSSGRHDRAFYEAMWTTLKQTGQWQGEVWNRRKSGEIFPEWTTLNTIRDEAGEVTNYVAIFADISAIKNSQAQVMYLAQHDHLTGLPNRTLLRDRLGQAMGLAQRANHQVALMLVDLDGFKTVNSSMGPQEGDLLLKEMARRIQAVVREGDTVARMGGDEFAIVLTPLDRATDSLKVASKVREAIVQPVTVAGRQMRFTASIGISVFPQDGASVNALLSHADAAMYTAKEAGRNTSRFFTEDMNSRALEHLVLLNAMTQGLERGEFHLQFQPQRPMSGKGLIGVEALLRWRHPELGLVPPDRFIRIAEDSGLIRPIGAWVLQEACRRAKGWNLPVAVNLSVVQLQDPDFFEVVTRALAESGVDPALIELEVTESVVMKDPRATVELLTRLRALGLRLAMDDFGTGYSSLAQLKRLPLHRLKIDRAFVRDVLTDPADQAVVQAVIAMGHALKLRIIAEGVETRDQLQVLTDFGCDEVQGYLFGHPAEPEVIDAERSADAPPAPPG